MRPVLTVHEEGTSRRHPLPARAVVGRDPGCDVVLADPTVSRKHAVLEVRAAGFRLRDLKSGNGSFVDGHAVEQAELTGSERLRFGAVLAELSLEEERDEELTASQKLRQSLSVPRARKARPVAVFVASTVGVLLLLTAAAWEKGCVGRRANAAAPAPASAPAR